MALVIIAIRLFGRPSVAQDGSWERVQTAGVLRVASSSDYHHFSYQNRDFAIYGFDPALIREIGDKLGVQVQITDCAFEGLHPVLDLGQADVAIAAKSSTVTRGQFVDFSNVYYVSKDGILAVRTLGLRASTKFLSLLDCELVFRKIPFIRLGRNYILLIPGLFRRICSLRIPSLNMPSTI